MKTVWILNHYAQEPGGPGGTRHFSLARHLREHGWRAIVIASSVEHGTGRQRLAEGERFRLDSYDGVTFLWLRGNAYTGNGGDRIRNMLGYTLAALRVPAAVLPAPDIVVGSSVHPFAAWAGARLAGRFGVPFVFEVRDLWPETLIAMGRISRSSLSAVWMRILEKYLYNKASRILTLLPKACDYISDLGISPKKVCWLPNGVDPDTFSPTYAENRIDRPFAFMYFGSHGIANGLPPIVKAVSLLRKNEPNLPVCLRLVGEGPEKENLIELATTLGVSDYIAFESAVPKADIPILASQADAFVVNVRGLELYKYGISLNKIFDYLAAARPIVFAGSAANNPVADAGAGLSVPADDVDGISEAMRKLILATPEERAAMGAAGRRHVQEHYSYSALAAKFAGILNECTSGASGGSKPT